MFVGTAISILESACCRGGGGTTTNGGFASLARKLSGTDSIQFCVAANVRLHPHQCYRRNPACFRRNSRSTARRTPSRARSTATAIHRTADIRTIRSESADGDVASRSDQCNTGTSTATAPIERSRRFCLLANLSVTRGLAVRGRHSKGYPTVLMLPNPGDGGSQFPQGNGYGTREGECAGQVEFKPHGTLADGTKITQTAAVSKDGTWPIYVPL